MMIESFQFGPLRTALITLATLASPARISAGGCSLLTKPKVDKRDRGQVAGSGLRHKVTDGLKMRRNRQTKQSSIWNAEFGHVAGVHVFAPRYVVFVQQIENGSADRLIAAWRRYRFRDAGHQMAERGSC